MFPQIVSTILIFTVLATGPLAVAQQAMVNSPVGAVQTLYHKAYSLADRYGNSYVNTVFADNILLTLAYMRGAAKENEHVDWKAVKEDFTYTMQLTPGQTFAFHDALLPQYEGKVIATTNAHFTSQEGFESDGWLVGDGVCHLASFMNVVARGAGLDVLSPTPHDFAVIPDVPRQYGVAIYYMPQEPDSSAEQNLYITNTFATPISFIFSHTGDTLTIAVEKNR